MNTPLNHIPVVSFNKSKHKHTQKHSIHSDSIIETMDKKHFYGSTTERCEHENQNKIQSGNSRSQKIMNIKPTKVPTTKDEDHKTKSTTVAKAKPTTTAKPKKKNPFGSAKPREEVLAKKGIDFHIIDERITKKSTVAHYTRVQDMHLKKLQDELTKAEEIWRNANENELPEDELRVVVEEKRRVLNDCMVRYKEENEAKMATIGNRHFERVSERRKRQADEHRNEEVHERVGYDKSGSCDDGKEDPFASFHRREDQNL